MSRVGSVAILVVLFCTFAAQPEAADLEVNFRVARGGSDIPMIIYVTGAQPGRSCLVAWSDNAGPTSVGGPRQADLGSNFSIVGVAFVASDGSCRFEFTPPAGVDTVYFQGAISSDGFATFDLTNGVAVPVVPRVRHATCADLAFTGQVWQYSGPADVNGLDLREWTDSQLHFLGCVGDGCSADTFYCTFDENAETLEFGTTGNGALRGLVDPGDLLGDLNPSSHLGCCSASEINGLCNAFDSNANGTGIDPIAALCDALGYTSGTILRELAVNTCPEIHATATDGLRWNSDFVTSSGFGAEFRCTGFK